VAERITSSRLTPSTGRDLSLPRDPDDARAVVETLCGEQAYAKLLGLHLVDAADLAVTLSLPLRDEVMQTYFVHGGAIASLADAASTFAVLTRLWPEYWASTVESSVQFLRPVQDVAGELVAFAHVRRFGRTLSFVEVMVTHDGREIATARSSQMRQARPKSAS